MNIIIILIIKIIIILGSLIGDNGFDPLGFSDTIPLTYARASELKHSRVAMLAVVGFLVQQQIHILTPEADPIKAVSALGLGPNLQILSFIGTIELATWKKTYSADEPGNLGFDPANQLKGKSKTQVDDLKLKELKNGQLISNKYNHYHHYHHHYYYRSSCYDSHYGTYLTRTHFWKTSCILSLCLLCKKLYIYYHYIHINHHHRSFCCFVVEF